MMALDVLNTFNDIDVIVPVPLHKSRLRKRGYNQSEYIAAGLAEVMHKSMDARSLYRTTANPSQTKKKRYERWTNVEDIFALKNPQRLSGRHILLVDDIVTTGATLEACAIALLKAENVKVSILTLARA
jgi:ComF family protein